MRDYHLDGLRPSETIRPGSVEELSAALRATASRGLAAVLWGAGTRMHVGNIPERYDVALDLTGLPQARIHEPGDLTLVASASERVADLNDHVARARQRLPFDVPVPETATVGGAVASDAPGLLRSSRGGIRDWVIGMKVAGPDGTVTKSGGRVVKNVQGYDLHRLHTGAFGTLGVIVEVAFKLVPAPAATRTVAVWFPDVTTAAGAAAAVYNAAFTPEAISVFTGGSAAEVASSLMPGASSAPGPVLLLARVSGGEQAVARQSSELLKIEKDAGAGGTTDLGTGGHPAQWERAGAGMLEAKVTARIASRPSDSFRILSALQAATAARPGLNLWARVDAGFGSLTANWWARDDEDAREAIEACRHAAALHRGSAVIERCPAGLKHGTDVFGVSGPALEIMRRMKQQYDPARVLNPGRFAGGI
jgi:glycolate oxidase FAD binding subunit